MLLSWYSSHYYYSIVLIVLLFIIKCGKDDRTNLMSPTGGCGNGAATQLAQHFHNFLNTAGPVNIDDPAECSLNVHWMFTECSLNVHWKVRWLSFWSIFTISLTRPSLWTLIILLDVHWMFTENRLNVYWMFTECSLKIDWMFTECSLNVHWMFTECSLNVHWMFTECSLHEW
jgi:hypothetical protein